MISFVNEFDQSATCCNFWSDSIEKNVFWWVLVRMIRQKNCRFCQVNVSDL